MLTTFKATNLFTMYGVELRIRHRIMGGVPRDPNTVLNWLMTRMGKNVVDAELLDRARTVLSERGIEGIEAGMDLEDMKAVAHEFAGDKKTVGFKVDPVHGLYIEGRQPKAGLKECVNILYADKRWGTTKKGPKSYVAERIFVPDRRIYLGQMEPSGVETIIGHVPSPQGQKSTLTRYEYADRPLIRFRMMSMQNCIEADIWAEVLTLFQEIGLGAVRSQSYGTFDVLRFGVLGKHEWDDLIVQEAETLQEEVLDGIAAD